MHESCGWAAERPGRSGAEARDLIRNAGGELSYVQCDVADAAGMERAVAAAKARFGAIHGVFHSAMTLADGSVESIAEGAFRAGMACKVEGSVSLARALRHEALDFLVFFSSGRRVRR